MKRSEKNGEAKKRSEAVICFPGRSTEGAALCAGYRAAASWWGQGVLSAGGTCLAPTGAERRPKPIGWVEGRQSPSGQG